MLTEKMTCTVSKLRCSQSKEFAAIAEQHLIELLWQPAVMFPALSSGF